MSDLADFASPGSIPTSLVSEFQLRPLTTGQVLDRTFALYRAHFWLFAGLAALPATLGVLVQLGSLSYTHVAGITAGTPFYRSIGLGLITVVGQILQFLAYGISLAATTSAVASLYLGRTAAIGSSMQAAMRHWGRYAGVVIMQFLVSCWPTLVLFTLGIFLLALVPALKFPAIKLIYGIVFAMGAVSIVYSVWMYLAVSLAMPASVVEDLKPMPAIRRSRALLPDRKFRIFLLYLLLYILFIVGVSLIGAAGAIFGLKHIGLLAIQTFGLVGGFVAAILITPILTVGLCLFYFDERVRREGFDIEFLMLQAAGRSMLPDDLAHHTGTMIDDAPLSPASE
jgi:hypothetical protein